MKTLIIALAALALAPAAMAHPMHGQRAGQHAASAPAMAAAPAVDTDGRELGSDPDPQVRLQLLRSAGIFDR